MNIEALKELREAYANTRGVAEALDELIELKGEQVPVAVVELNDNLTVAEIVGDIPRRKAVRELYEGALVIGQELFTAPQKPAESDRVPVASEIIPEGMKFSSAIPEFVGDTNEISSYRCWIHGNTRKVATQEQAYADAKAICAILTAPQKPVVLPQPFAARIGHPFNEGARTAMIPDDNGNWLSKFDVEHAIKMAGGIVKDGD